MSIEGQCHFFTIYFQVLYVLCFTRPRSGERLQEHWSSGFKTSEPGHKYISTAIFPEEQL